jgi:hypothetical protein
LVKSCCSNDDVRLKGGGRTPDVQQLKEEHDYPDILEDDNHALMLAAFPVDFRHVEQANNNQDEDVEHKGEGLRCTCEDVQRYHNQQRKEAKFELIHPLYQLHNGWIVLLNLRGLDCSVIE